MILILKIILPKSRKSHERVDDKQNPEKSTIGRINF